MSDQVFPVTTYGTIIIGSSPAMLLEAILQTQAGNGPTLVIEAHAQLGGHWTPQTRFGHQIDNGPHLLYNFNIDMSALFATLTRVTDCTFEEMQPAPRSESRLNPAMLEFSFGMRGSLMRKRLRAVRAVLSRHWLPGLKPFKYWRPLGGLSAIVSQFRAKLVSLGVEIRLSSRVRGLEECPYGTVRVILETGEVLTARSVKASAASLPVLADVATAYTLPSLDQRTYAQAYIYLRQARQNVFSFFRCYRHSKIFLAAELSNSAQPPLPENCAILSINMTSGMLAHNITETEIYTFLDQKRLIEGKGGIPEIAHVEWETIEYPIITKEMTDRVNTHLKSVEFIHCHNLVRTLYARLEKAKAFR